MSTDFRPAGLTANPKVEAVRSAASLQGATTNNGLDAKGSVSFEPEGWLGLADIYIDVGTNGEDVDFYAVKA